MKQEYQIRGNKVEIRLPNAVEAILLWSKVKKLVNEYKKKEGDEDQSLDSIDLYIAQCVSQLESFTDLSKTGISFEESLNDEEFFQPYKEMSGLFIDRMLVFFKKKD